MLETFNLLFVCCVVLLATVITSEACKYRTKVDFPSKILDKSSIARKFLSMSASLISKRKMISVNRNSSTMSIKNDVVTPEIFDP